MRQGPHGALQEPARRNELDSCSSVFALLRQASGRVDATQCDGSAVNVSLCFLPDCSHRLMHGKNLQHLRSARPRVSHLQLHRHRSCALTLDGRSSSHAECEGHSGLGRGVAYRARGYASTAVLYNGTVRDERHPSSCNHRDLQARPHDGICQHCTHLGGKRLQIYHFDLATGQVRTNTKVLHGAILTLHCHYRYASAFLSSPTGDVSVKWAQLVLAPDGADTVVCHTIGAQDDL
mmetsp:Transcript_71895/g.199507  ORF Transcript_71895/g.199507 Transcript_71895/m.199507 type:complete len:235 (+) Transcript_71895:271-975(+)